MNKKQRYDLDGIRNKLDELINEIDFMATEETDKYNDAPENLQQSEKFQKINDIATALDSAKGNLESAADDIDEALNY